MSDEARAAFPRRDLLKAGGALLIGFSLPIAIDAQDPSASRSCLARPTRSEAARYLIAIHADNTATVFHAMRSSGRVPRQPCCRWPPKSSISPWSR